MPFQGVLLGTGDIDVTRTASVILPGFLGKHVEIAGGAAAVHMARAVRNIIPSTDGFAGAATGVLGSGGALPTGWYYASGTFASIEVLEAAADHIKIQVTGTNSTGVARSPVIYGYNNPTSNGYRSGGATGQRITQRIDCAHITTTGHEVIATSAFLDDTEAAVTGNVASLARGFCSSIRADYAGTSTPITPADVTDVRPYLGWYVLDSETINSTITIWRWCAVIDSPDPAPEYVLSAEDEAGLEFYGSRNRNVVNNTIVTANLPAPLAYKPMLLKQPAMTNSMPYGRDVASWSSNSGVTVSDIPAFLKPGLASLVSDAGGAAGDAASHALSISVASDGVCGFRLVLRDRPEDDYSAFTVYFRLYDAADTGGLNLVSLTVSTDDGSVSVSDYNETAAEYDVVRRGGMWIITVGMVRDATKGSASYGLVYVYPTTDATAAAGDIVVESTEVYPDLDIWDILETSLIVTDGATASVDAATDAFDDANHADTTSVYYIEIIPFFPNAYKYTSQHCIFNMHTADSGILYLPTTDHRLSTYDGTSSSHNVDAYFNPRDVVRAAVLYEASGNMVVAVDGAYSTPVSFDGAYPNAVSELRIGGANRLPFGVRNWRRYDVATYSEGVDVIDSLMAFDYELLFEAFVYDDVQEQWVTQTQGIGNLVSYHLSSIYGMTSNAIYETDGAMQPVLHRHSDGEYFFWHQPGGTNSFKKARGNDGSIVGDCTTDTVPGIDGTDAALEVTTSAGGTGNQVNWSGYQVLTTHGQTDTIKGRIQKGTAGVEPRLYVGMRTAADGALSDSSVDIDAGTGEVTSSSKALNVTVVDRGNWWEVAWEPDHSTAGGTVGQYRCAAVPNVNSAAAVTVFDGLEIHIDASVDETKDLGPIFTDGAAASTDETVYTIQGTNAPDDLVALVCEVADIGETSLEDGVVYPLTSGASGADYLRTVASAASWSSHNGSGSGVAVSFAGHTGTHTLGVCTQAGVNTALRANGTTDEDSTYTGFTGSGVLNVGGAGKTDRPIGIRNVRAYRIEDYAAGKALIESIA